MKFYQQEGSKMVEVEQDPSLDIKTNRMQEDRAESDEVNVAVENPTDDGRNDS